MHLSNFNDTAFVLDILNYEYPNYECIEPDIDMYDANWLVVRIKVIDTSLGEWTAKGPFLLTYEIQRLQTWLISIKNKTVSETALGFIEPNLWFEILGKDNKYEILRIHFELEFRPDWANKNRETSEDMWIEFQMANLNFDSLIEDLHKFLDEFPSRCIEA